MIRSWASRTRQAAAALVIMVPLGSIGDEATAGETHPSRTSVRSSNYPDFGRIVLSTSKKISSQVDQNGDHVVVRLGGNVSLGAPSFPPRNVVSIQTDGATLDLVLTHGAQLRPSRKNGHIVLDIFDSVAAAPGTHPTEAAAAPPNRPPALLAASPERAGSSSAPPSPPVAVASAAVTPAVVAAMPAVAATTEGAAVTAERTPVAAQPLPAPAPPAPDSDVLETVQKATPGRDLLPENEGPVLLRARRIRLPKEMGGTAFLVAFESTTAAASFDKADGTYIVFDERRPVDMAALAGDPLFGGASVRLLPTGTLLTVPHRDTVSIVLTQLPQGWRIAALTTTPKLQPILTSFADGRLKLAAEQPGDVVTLADPITGATLLVGTQHRPGQGVQYSQSTTEFILHRTSQGVVVEPLSDAISLKQIPTGFSLAGSPAGLALSPVTGATPALMDAAHLTRRLNFSTMPPASLLRLAIKQLGDAASVPPLARGPRHHAAAESFMALGLAVESGSLLQMAAEQDPKEAASTDTGALTAIAALLAGRVDDARGLMNPKFDGTDEISLWRAVLQATQDEGSPSAAAVFAMTAPLAFQYPAPIRDHILPLIIETMVKGGEIPAAARLLDQRKDDPKLAYARALMREAEGNTAEALTMLDTIANGHDQFDSARAAVHAVELRLATKELDRAQAADALDKLLYAWRGDARDLALRQRVADLRAQAGAWRVALSVLRQAEADFPEQAAAIHTRLKDMFAEMIRDKTTDQMPPIEFVAAVDENTDLLPDAGHDEAVEQSVADKLIVLDLPSRAKPVLEKLLHQAKSPVTKARFATSLATLQSHEGDDIGALAVLDASQTEDLPADLAEQRLLLRATSVARRGDPAGAAAMLAPVQSGRAIQARAQILETALDWPGAEQAWLNYTDLTLPGSGLLDEAQTQSVMRLATATARAHDDAGLATLRLKYGERISTGPLGDMFRLLTAEPVKTMADIKRSQQETALAASIPAGLKAVRANVPGR